MNAYQKYGDEWESEVMKNSKVVIIGMFRNVAKERDALQAELAELRTRAEQAEEDCLFNCNDILTAALKGDK